MNDLRSHNDDGATPEATRPDSEDALREQIGLIARLGAGLCAGAICRIAWRTAAAAGTVRAPAGAATDGVLDAIIAAVERHPGLPPDEAGGSLRIAPGELASATHGRGAGERFDAAAVAIGAATDSGAAVKAIVAAPTGRRAAELEAAAELTARASMGVLQAAAGFSSREFWRRRAADAAGRLARAKSELSAQSAAGRRLEGAIDKLRRQRPRNRFAGVGAAIAASGPFESWIVAIADDGLMRVAASAGVLAPAAPIEGESALTDCFERQTPLVRAPQSDRPNAVAEDRLFARFAGYLCVPLKSGAIALAAHERIDDEMAARAEAIAGRLDPLIDAWRVEEEAERLRQLVRNLGLRMFGAVDGERARIARDLHDHQAQLLAAARIALEAEPDGARGIFKQLEDALRLRVRELRPAVLGRSSLEEALRYELRRLSEAGIKGRLMQAKRMNSLTRPVQQLCYQVAREALANVVRHSAATRVEVSVEKRGGRVRLSILDNGKGIRDGESRGGMGLSGLRERLELMGGRLKVESKPGAMRLIAEIPEPA